MRTRRNLEFLGPARKPRPTQTIPGSAERIEILKARVADRQEVFSASDGSEDGAGLRIVVSRNGKPRIVGVERRIAEKQIYITAVKIVLFSERLVFLRRRRGLLMIQLARRSGLSPHAIYYLETGAREPALATAIALARALEVPVSILAGELVDQY